MSFSSDEGYVPLSFEQIMEDLMDRVNTQFGTTFTYETFVGTNYYKFLYGAVQRIQASEVKTSEIFQALTQYLAITNEMISRPVITAPGVIDKLTEEGYIASAKPMIDADAGKISICVDVVDNHARGQFEITSYANLVSGTDDTITVGATAFTAQVGAATLGTATFQAATSNSATATSLAAQINAHATAGALVEARADGAIVYIRALAGGTAGNSIALGYTDNDTNVGATKSGTTLTGGIAIDDNEDDYDDVKLDICTIIKDTTALGCVTQGDEIEALTLSNGQSFNYKYFLPDRQRTYLKLTITLSENNQVVILPPDEIKQILMDNIAEKYRLGKNFEPQKYFSIEDAPWASQVHLEWSDDNATWVDTVYDSAFDDLFECALADVTLVEE